MREELSIYKCDRCGEDVGFKDESPDFHVRTLNDSGWRRIAISSMPEPGIQLTKIGGLRDLCRLCYIGLVAYIEMGDCRLDVNIPSTSTGPIFGGTSPITRPEERKDSQSSET